MSNNREFVMFQPLTIKHIDNMLSCDRERKGSATDEVHMDRIL